MNAEVGNVFISYISEVNRYRSLTTRLLFNNGCAVSTNRRSNSCGDSPPLAGIPSVWSPGKILRGGLWRAKIGSFRFESPPSGQVKNWKEEAAK